MNQSNYKVYAYIVRHNYILGGMLFTICKAQQLFRPYILAIIRLYNEISLYNLKMANIYGRNM